MVIPSLIGQRVYIDSSALIYAFEVPHLYPGLRTKLFVPFSRGQLTLVSSWVTFAEVIIHPVRLGDSILETTYRQLFQPSPVFEILRSISKFRIKRPEFGSLTDSNSPMQSTLPRAWPRIASASLLAMFGGHMQV